jgi:ABC-type Na+ efflux pump permease subunit
MRVNKKDFTGMPKVFKFTLQQYFKSKTSIVMLVIMFLTSGSTLFISSFSASAGTLKEAETKKLYIVNDTQYRLTADEIVRANSLFSQMEVIQSEESLEAVQNRLDGGEIYSAAVNITLDSEYGAYMVTAYSGLDSKISALEMSALSSALISAFSEARLKTMDATEEQLKTAMAPYSVNVVDYDKYTGEEKNLSFDKTFGISFMYTVLLFMLIMYSTQYIVRSIIDEKTTNLVETLMVSIRPLALIMGKILASMLLMVLNFVAIAGGFIISYLVMGLLPDSLYSSKDIIATLGLDSALSNLNWSTGIIFIVSILLGYITFSIIGGISGTSCSTMEDAESASAVVMLLCFFGYIGSIATMAFGGKAVSIVVSLVPFLSVFTAPVRYTLGQIDLVILIISWVIQGGLALLLFRFCAAVYETLLMYKGNRVKLKQLLSMAKTVKGGGKA